jgi:hypothetical protein
MRGFVCASLLGVAATLTFLNAISAIYKPFIGCAGDGVLQQLFITPWL